MWGRRSVFVVCRHACLCRPLTDHKEEVEYGAWMDPDFMKPLESHGEAVSVSEGGRQAIQVNLIAADAQ